MLISKHIIGPNGVLMEFYRVNSPLPGKQAEFTQIYPTIGYLNELILLLNQLQMYCTEKGFFLNHKPNEANTLIKLSETDPIRGTFIPVYQFGIAYS